MKSAQEQATIFTSIFWATVKEKGIVGASDAMKKQMDALEATLKLVDRRSLFARLAAQEAAQGVEHDGQEAVVGL